MAQESKAFTSFNDTISKDHPKFQPEKDRYHLYVSLGCPFAQRAHLALAIKGLQDVIGLSVAHPVMVYTKPEVEGDDHKGFPFYGPEDGPVHNAEGKGSFTCEGCIPDNINGAKTIRELYEIASSDYTGRYSVPVFWDKKEKTIVCNESADLLRIINSSFNDFAKHPEIDLYPEALRSEIDEVNNHYQPPLVFGVYGAGFAQDQAGYEAAYEKFFGGLEDLEERLSKQRYAVQNTFTEADLRLFVCLIRWCEAHDVCFKLNKKRLSDYPNIFNWMKDVYQFPGVAETVNIKHIHMIYFGGRDNGIFPKENGYIEEFQKEHDRARFS